MVFLTLFLGWFFYGFVDGFLLVFAPAAEHPGAPPMGTLFYGFFLWPAIGLGPVT